eukprot:GHVO01051538.1.p1 GENE.GHVO01051538.1~~GHVO01051538.1.p1  ORF type:complete len:132 (+),score=30.42 GHVO01051538.1:147-542(+)
MSQIDTGPFDPCHHELCTEMIDLVLEVSAIYGEPHKDKTPTDDAPPKTDPGSTEATPPPEAPPSPILTCPIKPAMCIVQLNSGHILYMQEVDKLLALACVLREENFDRQFLIDFNIRVFRDAVLGLFGIQP